MMIVEVRIITIVILLAFLGYKLISRQFDLVDAFVFLLPLDSVLNDSLGLRLTAFQFTGFVGLVLLIFFKVEKAGYYKYAIPFFLYAIVLTIFTSIALIQPIEVKMGNFFREEGRFISQIVLFLFFKYGFFFFAENTRFNTGKFKKVLKIYVYAVCVQAILGLIQLGTFFFTRQDIYPIPRPENLPYDSAAYEMLGNPFVRIGALAGEPKRLAAELVVALAILVLSQKFDRGWFRGKQGILILLLILALFFTLSSGGYVLFAGLLILIAFLDISRLKIPVRLNGATILTSFLIIFTVYFFFDLIDIVIQKRLINRKLYAEDFDEVILTFLMNEPSWLFFGTGMGNVHNEANYYMLQYPLYAFAHNTPFTAKSGYLTLLSETGIIGTSLFIFFVGMIFIKLHGLKISRKERHFLTYLLFILLVFFLGRAWLIYHFLFFSGLIFGYARYVKNRSNYKDLQLE